MSFAAPLLAAFLAGWLAASFASSAASGLDPLLAPGCQDGLPPIDPRVRAAIERLDRGDRAGALADLEALRAATSDDVVVQLTIANQLVQRQEYAAAEPAARRGLELDPGSFPGLLLLGTCLVGTDRHEEAETLYRAALPRFSGTADEADLVFSLAMSCALQNKRLEAAELFGRAIELQPKNPLFHFSAAENELNLKRLDAAAAGFRRAGELEPPHADATWKLAVTLAAAGRPAEAEPLFAKALESGAPPARQAAAFHYAVFLFERGRHEAALPLLERTVQARPQDRVAWHYLARTLRALGRKEESAKALERYRRIQAREDREETEYLLSLLREQLARPGGERKGMPERR